MGLLWQGEKLFISTYLETTCQQVTFYCSNACLHLLLWRTSQEQIWPDLFHNSWTPDWSQVCYWKFALLGPRPQLPTHFTSFSKVRRKQRVFTGTVGQKKRSMVLSIFVFRIVHNYERSLKLLNATPVWSPDKKWTAGSAFALIHSKKKKKKQNQAMKRKKSVQHQWRQNWGKWRQRQDPRIELVFLLPTLTGVFELIKMSSFYCQGFPGVWKLVLEFGGLFWSFPCLHSLVCPTPHPDAEEGAELQSCSSFSFSRTQMSSREKIFVHSIVYNGPQKKKQGSS